MGYAEIVGRKKMIGVQEDMIENTAMTMARERSLAGHKRCKPQRA